MRKRLANFLAAISPDCRTSVKLLSAPDAADLPALHRWGLRLHLVLCAFCRRYRQETDKLRSAVPSESEPMSIPDGSLTNEARERMTAKLRQNASASGGEHRHGAACDHH